MKKSTFKMTETRFSKREGLTPYHNSKAFRYMPLTREDTMPYFQYVSSKARTEWDGKPYHNLRVVVPPKVLPVVYRGDALPEIRHGEVPEYGYIYLNGRNFNLLFEYIDEVEWEGSDGEIQTSDVVAHSVLPLRLPKSWSTKTRRKLKKSTKMFLKELRKELCR